MKKSHININIQNLPTNYLREIIRSLDNETWEEDAPLRKLAIAVHGSDNIMLMLGLAVPLAIELDNRILTNRI